MNLPGWLSKTVDVIHFILPRYKDLDGLLSDVLARHLLAPDNPNRIATAELYGAFRWGESLLVTSGFIALVLGLSCWRFARRDY
jgi:hypothetical protein